MNHSKWSYIGVGTSIMCAFVGALTHIISALLIGAILTIYNWYIAEAQYKNEIEIAITQYELKKAQDDAETGDSK